MRIFCEEVNNHTRQKGHPFLINTNNRIAKEIRRNRERREDKGNTTRQKRTMRLSTCSTRFLLVISILARGSYADAQKSVSRNRHQSAITNGGLNDKHDE
eukprot:9123084-Ditylum_brightwellii.AAC.1